MKTRCVLKLASLVVLCLAMVLFSPGLVGSLKLDISLDPDISAKAGPTIIMTLQNRCNCSISVYESMDQPETSDFLFTLRELSGRQVPLTEYGVRIRDSAIPSISGYFRTLRPTAKLQHRLSLGELYQLRSGETYVFSAARRDARVFEHFGIPVESNKLQFQCK